MVKKVVEKKTGEKYASKAAKMKHEKAEGPKIRRYSRLPYFCYRDKVCGRKS